MEHKANFEFSPRVLILLGEQLIQDKKIALYELVKNSYDADANEVKVNIGKDSIVIEDDGCGMNWDTIKNVWLKPGVSEKRQDIEKEQRTKKYARIPIGEKGVGRLGAHKLGSTIEIYTRQENCKEVYLSIDWRNFEDKSSMKDIPPIIIQEREAEVFLFNKTGTKIVIKELKETWDDITIEKIANDLFKLKSPFQDKSDFNIILQAENNNKVYDFDKKLKFIKNNALYYFKVEFDSKKIHSFLYEFNPWSFMKKSKQMKIELNDQSHRLLGNKTLQEFLESWKKNLWIYDDKKYESFGSTVFEGYIYDLDNKLLKEQFTKDEKNLIKEYLASSGGIRVYRDGLRVLNYGEQGQDILSLDLERLNNPGDKVSSNQILSIISLNRIESKMLEEKTNREGFINNSTFSDFQKILNDIMSIINKFRQLNKEEISEFYLQKTKDNSRIEQKVENIIDIVNAAHLAPEDSEKIIKEMNSFVHEYKGLKSILLQASSNALNLSFVVHELDKHLHMLEQEIKKGDLASIHKSFMVHKSIIIAYKDLIRADPIKKQKISNIITQAIFIYQFRFSNHSITLGTENVPQDIELTCQKNLIISIFSNIFDNAIYWLDNYEVVQKNIFIKVYLDDKFINIIVADNGKGFNIDFELALELGMSGRRDKRSMGIGLHLVQLVVDAHNGIIEQGDYKEEGLDKEYKDGAIIKLKFMRN